MSNCALDLLVECELLTASGHLIDLEQLPSQEVSSRVSQYINGRIQTSKDEVENYHSTDKLNALFGTGSTSLTRDNLLSSALVYDSIVIDDPLVSSNPSIELKSLQEGLKFFSWAFVLIKSDFIKILPISFFNRPSDTVPLLLSDDAFKSSIPTPIHDFIHENAFVRSVLRDDAGQMLILKEDAVEKRRPALHVGFDNDYWKSGCSLYLLSKIENHRKNEAGELVCQQGWDPNRIVEKEQFDVWAYQSINQAMRARLKNIYNETCLASKIGHTYVTESGFEAKVLSMTGINNADEKDKAARFLDANDSFIRIESPETIVELRTRYGAAFERFNYSLQHIVEELTEIDPDKFDQKAQRLFHSEVLPQIEDLRANVGKVSRAGLRGGLATLVGLSAAIATGSVVPLIPAIMLGAAGGLTEALPIVSQQIGLKKKPAYIWHRVTKK